MHATLDLVNNGNILIHGIAHEIINFPDGHKHFKLTHKHDLFKGYWLIEIITRLKDYNDVFLLKQAVEAIRSVYPKITLNLTITYLLAARYDRAMYEGDSEDLRIVANDINSLNFNEVVVIEPHSNVSTLLINNSKGYTPLDTAVANYISTMDNQENLVIFAPDLGAVKRTEAFIKENKITAPIGYLNKHRNLLTGEILGMQILSDIPLEGKTVLLYDDLCDGGRTFIEASKLLREKGVTTIWLAVTHGLFSKGIDVLFEDGPGKIDLIFTTNSYQKQPTHPQLLVTLI